MNGGRLSDEHTALADLPSSRYNLDEIGGVPMVQTALKYDLEVLEDGRVELCVPFAPGTSITVFVIKEPDNTFDALSAAQSSLDFWDNPSDDADWNDTYG
jgi:hypothetical protein